MRFITLQRWLLAVLVFVLPTHFFLVLPSHNEYIKGLRIDYLIPKVYLSQLLLLLIVCIWIIKKGKISKIKKILKKQYNTLSFRWVLIFAGGILLTQFFTPNPLTSIIHTVTIFTALFFVVYLHRNPLVMQHVSFSLALASTIIFQAGVGIYQWYNQHSLVGYYLLGEPDIPQFTGLAKDTVWNSEKVLAYGTSAHPNILAGVLALYLFLLLKQHQKNPTKLHQLLVFICFVLVGTTLAVTQSISGCLLLITTGMLLFIPQKQKKLGIKILGTVALLFFFLTPWLISTHVSSSLPSVFRRAILNNAAEHMFLHNFVTGVGSNMFTRTVEQYTVNTEIVRFVQPAHHVGLLLLAEWGILGLFLILASLKVLYNRKLLLAAICCFWIFIPALSLDHYLYTQVPGILLFALTAGYMSIAVKVQD